MKEDAYKCPACGCELDARHYCHGCLRSFKDDIEYNEAHGKLAPRQSAVRDILDGKLKELIQQYVPADKVTEESIRGLRNHFLSMLQTHYHVPAYDAYPWLIKDEQKQQPQAAWPEVKTIKAETGQVIEITVPLADQVPDDADQYSGDMQVILRVINNQIELEAPDVETCNEAPGQAIPILIEQAGGRLHLVAWDKENEDPFIDAYWKRSLASHEALAEARREVAALIEESEMEMKAAFTQK